MSEQELQPGSSSAECGFVVTAIDNVRDYWDHGMVNRHWTVLDAPELIIVTIDDGLH
jgi:hypothetical protein